MDPVWSEDTILAHHDTVLLLGITRLTNQEQTTTYSNIKENELNVLDDANWAIPKCISANVIDSNE